METTARVVVVGGGAVGCSIAYHLARAGWSEIVLLERDELTSGSTWHAAGLLPLFNMSYAVSHIHDYSLRMYGEIGDEVGLDPGLFTVGNLRMAQTQERMDEYRLYATIAETVGIPYEWLSPKEMGERWPLIRTEDLVGAIYHPTDGYINPADVTQAMAAAARKRGVRIHRKKHVESFEPVQSGSGGWKVSGYDLDSKEPFSLVTEHVVTATGNHGQATAEAIGIYIPAMPVEHQYVVTGESETLAGWRAEGNPEHPVVRDADAKWYVREERKGWILGPYEATAPAWAVWGVPEGFRAELLTPAIERIEEELLSGIHRVPCFEEGGIKEVYNGSICYTPDGNPLLGPAPGVSNFWFAEGFSFGITAAGGAGHYLAQVMTEGEAEIDMWSLDPRRYGDWMTRAYARTKNEEAYNHVYVLHHPDEEREAGRPLRTAPCYERMRARGAVFGQVNGWERPNYFAEGEDFDDRAARSFRRGDWWRFAAEEARAVRGGLGLYDATAFAKHRVHGPGATGFLDWLTCNRLPVPGRIGLTYGLTDAGTIRTEFTCLRLAQDDYYLVTSGAAQAYDHDYLCQEAAEWEDRHGLRVNVGDETVKWGVFAIAGPESRELLRRVVHLPDPEAGLTNAAFPWLSARRIEFGMCPVRAIRVAYTGELGWELHHPMEMQNYLFDRLWDAGESLNLRLFGARAQNWLRQEKSYRAFGSDLGRDATPLESSLGRFVDLSKDFRGKEAMQNTGIRSHCVTVLIDGPTDADPWGREALYDETGKTHVGRLTSGGWSVHFEKQIGIGYVAPGREKPGTPLRVKMLDELWPAEVTAESPYDPANKTIRADG